MPDDNAEFIGRTVVEVRPLTQQEVEDVYWPHTAAPLALVLDDGMVLFPSQDREGNDSGVFFIAGLQRLDQLVGRTITDDRAITDGELRHFGWHEDALDGRPLVLVFDDVFVYPASDIEGHAAGTMFGKPRDGETLAWQYPPGQ